MMYGVRAFARDRRDIKILDNLTTIAYVNRLGGTKSQILVEIVAELWQWCLEYRKTVIARHLPGLQNIRADFMSRYKVDRSDWMFKSTTISDPESTVGAIRDRPLRHPVDETAHNLLQLEARS